MPSGREPTPLERLEAELRALLVPYEDELETAEIYGIEVLRRPGAKAHDWFAGVRPAAGSVKLMLLPIHAHPGLLAGVSPVLARRRSGASLLTLKIGDESLLPELEGLVARAFDAYMAGA